MGEFWKNEWHLFKQDMGMVKEFFMQPVYLGSDPNLKLKPSVEELEEKSSEGGFWVKEWNLFKQDMNNAAEFLTQPVEFK